MMNDISFFRLLVITLEDCGCSCIFTIPGSLTPLLALIRAEADAMVQETELSERRRTRSLAQDDLVECRGTREPRIVNMEAHA